MQIMKTRILPLLTLLFVATSCEKVIDESFAPFTLADEGKVINEDANDYLYASSLTRDKVFTVNGVSFTMVRVAGGTFTMGNNTDESSSPEHEVTLSTYYIGSTEVTQELYKAVMGSCPTSYRQPHSPVGKVTHQQATAFVDKLRILTGYAFCLPTEAQWEFAARGGNKSRGYEFSGSNKKREVGYFSQNGTEPKPVKSYRPNELGIYDMTGNMEEWCSDWHGDYPSSATTNPVGPTSGKGHVIRGGSWYSLDSYAKVYYRSWMFDSKAFSDTGFRIALR